MKIDLTVENGFAKFEIYDCSFRKPQTISKNLFKKVEKLSGIKGTDFFDYEWRYWWDSIKTNTGEYHYEEKWEDMDGKLRVVWVIDLSCDYEGNFNYMYFGYSLKDYESSLHLTLS